MTMNEVEAAALALGRCPQQPYWHNNALLAAKHYFT